MIIPDFFHLNRSTARPIALKYHCNCSALLPFFEFLPAGFWGTEDKTENGWSGDFLEILSS